MLTRESRQVHVLRAGGICLRLLKPSGLMGRAVGLLNHLSLASDEGIIFGRSLLFHTWGMSFDILVVFLNSQGAQVAPPRLVRPGRLFVAPWSAKHVAEIHPCHRELFEGEWRRLIGSEKE